MKEHFLQYARYNAWANKKMIDVMNGLSDAQSEQEIVSSFPSIKATVIHSWGAEDMWLQRLLLTENPVWKPSVFNGTAGEACTAWLDCSQKLIDFVQQQRDDAAFDHVVAYYNLKREHNKTPVREILNHVFNHATYHRGQLVTMLRQVGVTKIPGTDFIAYSRNPKS